MPDALERGLSIALLAGVLGLGVLAIAVAVYAVGSFMLMGAHVQDRGFAISLRELAREVFLALVTQPLVPLFYLIGRRLSAKGAGTPVVFVHGYMQNRANFLGLARSLERRGIGPLYGINYPWFAPLDANAVRLHRFITRVCEETKRPQVDLVCHSMGGLIAMEMMRVEAELGELRVRRCVTIATPHAGVVWRGPILGFGATSLRRGSKLLEAHAAHKVTIPCLSIFSTHDNIVFPKETAMLGARGGRDVEIDGRAHLSILFASRVADEVAGFLAEPGPTAV